MKALLVILDGLGDRTFPELENNTPLQFAPTPNLDKLAEQGMNGLMYSLSPGFAPATELAHFTLFGHPRSDFPGRAVFETIGEGLELGFEEVVLRASFVSVEEEGEKLIVVDRMLGVTENILSELAEEIVENKFGTLGFKYVYNSQRQGILFLKGNASKYVSDSDPFTVGKPISKVRALEEATDYKKAVQTADSINQFLRWVYRKLDNHPLNKRRRERGLRPINFLVTRWVGLRKKIPLFYEMYGFKGASVASGAMLKGLMSEMGLDFIEALSPDDQQLDLEQRLKTAVHVLESEYDFVHVHTKLPDEAAHTKNPKFKAEVIEKLDKAFGLLLEDGFIPKDVLVVVTSDHSTPSSGELIHSGEPVPVLFIGATVRVDNVREFNEISCTKGALGQITGDDLMRLILNFTDRIKYSGSRLTAKNLPYYPINIDFLEK